MSISCRAQKGWEKQRETLIPSARPVRDDDGRGGPLVALGGGAVIVKNRPEEEEEEEDRGVSWSSVLTVGAPPPPAPAPGC